jgi:hypothetical protein
MKSPQKNGSASSRGANGKRVLEHELPLRSASLGSPIFVESWNGGSPLNWVEFMGRWEVGRSDRPGPVTDDSAGIDP